ncbi:hypothetical protein KMZ68_13805 [Bradyrhizobium sediminis]|uniref:Uncharacterized protein n=1 Tax=Bradyrhizobium sediminis TaxID=2840469 RepID=A0A975NKH4_9BRAD|nr:hypothetical protein [Bradyrhizobium sediminis]QWG16119.1 hypothetical protein KMZ68_13805 [Bradyrhizobium sediminis]
MADPYSGVSITGYNSNPPVDDGTATEANRVKWSTIKSKLNDPVKDRQDSINTALIAAFGKIDGGVTSTGISYTVISTDQGKLVRGTAAGITITSPDATDVDAPFVFGLLNDSTGDITFDGSGSQTIDGDASVTVPAGAGFRVRTDGTNWFTEGQNFQRTLVQPQGYLTLVSAATAPLSPVPASDQSAKTSVYYRPYKGNLIPIPNGTLFSVREFSELTLSLNANHVASSIYDVFIFADSTGAITIGTGPVWSVVTAGSCARGTGAGTTELDILKGLPVNKVAMTARNGATTYSVAAASAVYVGSIFIDSSAGLITCHVDWGQSRKWGVWNAFNREPIMLKCGDSTSSWSDTPTTWRQSQGDANNFIHVFSGLAEEFYNLDFEQTLKTSINNDTSNSQISIGYNSTTTESGRVGKLIFSSAAAGLSSITQSIRATHIAPPSIGINKVNAIEQAPSGTTNNTYTGTQSDMILSAKWRG